jgi:CheY-like chemotaxis protein
VLLADDDPAIVELTALRLHFAGFEVTTAVDGEDAWRTYLEHGCDLLLTDHHMPRLSGIELIARVRTHGDPLPVILASGRLEPDDIPYTLRDQITAFLAKPFPNTVLVETIRRCLGQTVA